MSGTELKHKLNKDLKMLKLPIEEFVIDVRPYSKSFYGRYFPDYKNEGAKIRIYPYKFRSGDTMFSYSTVLYHTIHEVCHHLQYTNPNYTRKKGVMHDPQFYALLNRYVDRAEKLGMIKMKEVCFE